MSIILEAAPLAGPLRIILPIVIVAAAVAIPLSLALWRLKSRTRPRHLRIPYADRDALIYQVTKILGLVGFSQGPAAGDAVLFAPNALQKMFGVVPIELLFDQPASARLTATHQIMRRIAHNFRGSTEEKYTGRSTFPWKGFATAFALLLGTMAVLIGAFFLTHRNNTPSDLTAELDVVQALNITADQARRGDTVEVMIVHTGKPIKVHIPAGTTEGTRLRFKSMGMAPPNGGPNGNFYLALHIQ